MPKIIHVLFIFIGFSLTSKCQIVNIPDSNFIAALLNHNPVVDTNGDGEIQVEEAELVDSLTLNNFAFSNLEGISSFINLTYLYCHPDHQLTSLDVSGLSKLTTLICSGKISFPGPLTLLDISGLVNLTSLSCGNNELTSLDVSGLANLTSLSCGNNQLTLLDVSGLVNLISLHCDSNPLTSLDVSGLVNLTSLGCGANELTSLDVSGLVNLTSLSCDSNQLISLDVSDLANLTSIYCPGNEISLLDVSRLVNLTSLICNSNIITSLDVSGLVNLTFLICSSNKITSLDVAGLSNLTFFSCSNNKIISLDVSKIYDLNYFYCHNNPLKYLNVKNGIEKVSVNSLEGVNDSIVVCADLFNFNVINSLFRQDDIINGIVTSYCSYDPSGLFNTFTGQVIYSPTSNCVQYTDIARNIELIIADNNEQGSSYTNQNGEYIVYSSSLDTITILPILNSTYYEVNPTYYKVKLDSFDITTTLDFCLTPAGEFNDLEITMIPLNDARPGFDASYTILYENVGTTTQSGLGSLYFDEELLSFKEASEETFVLTDSQSSGGLYWLYDDLAPFEKRQIVVTFTVATPPIVDSGTELPFTAAISHMQNDETGRNNVFHLNQIAVNSLDPNDKVCLQGSLIDITSKEDYLHYTIRFQNIGIAEAINVVVKDVLPDQLDWSSFEPIASSHPNRIDRSDGNRVEFIFENINLPGMDDEENSHGFVTFKIKPQDTLILGSVIPNSAEIYFDFNAPIETNIVMTEIVHLVVSADDINNQSSIKIHPNPTSDELFISTANQSRIKGYEIMSSSGQRIITAHDVRQNQLTRIDISDLLVGIYFIRIITDGGSITERFIKM